MPVISSTIMVDAFNIYDKMEKNNILLSFKGDVTSELLTSILQIMENKMDNMQEEPKMKKKVYNVLVECLQNLYHHMDDVADAAGDVNRSAIFFARISADVPAAWTSPMSGIEIIPSGLMTTSRDKS